MSELPLDILKNEYIPLIEMPKKYNISVPKVMKLINSKKIRYAEFKAPGDIRRTIHVNPKDVLYALEEENK